MHNICILLIFIALLSICDCFFKSKGFQRNAGKFRRDIKEKLKAPSRLEENQIHLGRYLLKNCAVSDAKLPVNGKQSEQSILPLRSAHLRKVHSGLRKVLQDYFDKIGHRSALDRLQLAWRPDEISRLNILSNPALGEKYKITNTEIKRPLDDNPIGSKEWGKLNVSERAFHLPGPSKLQQINRFIAQSLFERPPISENEKSWDRTPDPTRNLELLLNKNSSDISPLVKPILAKTSFLTIMGNKSGDINPFQQINPGDKSIKELNLNKAGGDLFPRDNIFRQKSNDEPREGYKGRVQMNDEQSLKSARRLFDVIQSQNPLDLLNIPVLMNSFTLESHNRNSKITNSKIEKQPIGSAVLETKEEVTQADPLSDLTTQKLLFPPDYFNTEEKSRITGSMSNFGNETWEKGYVPWDPISSVLTKGVGNLSLVLIPFNRIRFDSLIQNPEKGFNELNKNSSDVKLLSPFSEEMRKINQIQDIFSKHFNDLNLRDFMDLRPPKIGNAKEETVNLFTTPTLKKTDDINFQKRVEDFFKEAKFNSSELPGFNSRSLKCKPENVDCRTKDLISIFNSSHFALEPKKSNYHEQRENLLPLLKVTANMAITKYCNNPMLEDNKRGDFKTNSSTLPKNRTVNISDNATSNQNLETSHADNQINMVSSAPFAASTALEYQSKPKKLKLEDKGQIQSSSSSMSSSNDGQDLRDAHSLNVTSDSLISAVNPLQQSLKSSKYFPKNSKQNDDSENSSSYFLGIETGNIIIHSTTENSKSKNVQEPNVGKGGDDDKYISKVLSKNDSSNEPLKNELYGDSFTGDNSEYGTTLTPLDTTENTSSLLDQNGEKPSNPRLRDNDVKYCAAELKDVLSAMLIDESRDQGKWSKSLSSEPRMNPVNNTPSTVHVVNHSINSLNAEMQSGNSTAVANMTNNSSINVIPTSLSKIAANPPANFSSDPQISNLTLISNIKSTSRLLKDPQLKPEKMLASISKKKENELHGNHQLTNEIARYYMSNRTHANVEETMGRDTKCEATCRIPAILIEILNRMESIVNGSAGYNMVIVPPKPNNDRDSTELPANALNADESLESGADKKEILHHTSVEPKIIMTDTPARLTTEDIYQVKTTEIPDGSRTDNIYHIMTMGKDPVIKHLVSEQLNSLTATLSTNEDETTDSYNNLTNQEMYLLQNYSNLQESRPLILVAIDPWKSTENLSTLQVLQPNHEPLGVFIKMSSIPNKLETGSSIPKSPIVQIGEPDSLYPPPSVALKCTTSCSTECKVKQVTVFPIYPMYPVYPLKPIIVGNMTSDLIPH